MKNKPEITSQTDVLRNGLAERVRTVSEQDFDELAFDIFAHQVKENSVYREYCRLLGKDTENVRDVADIPFLPINLFRTHDILTNVWEPEIVFESSTTTGQIPARHAVRDLPFYHQNALRGFRYVIGKSVSDFLWLALLPSYTDRPASSLVSMVAHFISAGKQGSRFITSDEIAVVLGFAERSGTPAVLISVSFALLDFAESETFPLSHTWVMETGGMKGRRTEPTRAELHQEIKGAFNVPTVYSEYGMTELLSQAWSTGEGIFRPAPTLRVFTRELSDPTTLQDPGLRGPLNMIDLANLDTCAFLATEDVGLVHHDGSFEVYGRLDASELRGCNLMYV